MKRLAYLIGTFPALTETFILGEIQALRACGIGLQLFALHRPHQGYQKAEGADFVAETHYGPPLFSWRLWGPNLQMLSRAPGRYLKILVSLMVRTMPNPVHCLKSLRIFPIAVAFAEAMQEARIEHVHAHWATYPATVAYVISRLLNISYSITAHAYDATLIRCLMKEKIRHATFIVTCTDMNRHFLTSLVPDTAAKILVNHHGIFLDRFAPHGNPVQKGPDFLHLLSCGSLYPRKGFSDLLEACRLLRDRGRHFQCAIVGEGPLRSQLEAFIRKYQLEGCVRLLGALPHKDVIEHYRNADLFVLSCVAHYLGWREILMAPVLCLEVGFAAPFRPLSDGIPNVLVEAMAMGVPVVSTCTAGVPELIEDGWNGSLVPERAPASLATAIERLMDDTHQRQQQARQARETVLQRFDRNKNIEELISLFTAQPDDIPALIAALNGETSIGQQVHNGT